MAERKTSREAEWEKNMRVIEEVYDHSQPRGPRTRARPQMRLEGGWPVPRGVPMNNKDPATFNPERHYDKKTGTMQRVRLVHDRDTQNQRFKSRKV